jgi:hypothetical protein
MPADTRSSMYKHLVYPGFSAVMHTYTILAITNLDQTQAPNLFLFLQSLQHIVTEEKDDLCNTLNQRWNYTKTCARIPT